MSIRNLLETWRKVRRVRPGDVARVLRYRLRWAWAQARYDLRPGMPAQPCSLGAALSRFPRWVWGGERRRLPPPFNDAILAVSVLPQGLSLDIGQGCMTIEAVDEPIVRVRAARQAPLPPFFSYATLREPQTVGAVVEASGTLLSVRTAQVAVTVRREPMSLVVGAADGDPLLAGLLVAWDDDNGWVRCPLAGGAQFYGLGERAAPLALRGRRFRLTTRDPEGYRPGDDPLYMNIPFLLVWQGERAYGLLFDSTYEGEIDLGHTHTGEWFYRTSGPEIRIDIIVGDSLAEVVQRYTGQTGRMSLPPLWALGYHQSRWSYESAARVEAIAGEFRARLLPCDAIHLDIDYMEGFRCFTWNRETFPDPPGLVAALRRQGFKAVAMIDPGIKVDAGYAVCADGLAQGVFLKMPDGSPVHGPVWPGECYFPDFTRPAVRRWWGGLYEDLTAAGVAGFWNDMNEPAVFGSPSLPNAVQYDLEGRGGDHREGRSAYGMQMVRATYEGLGRLRPRERNWVFTRSGYAGVQRYASGWTGDNASTWDHLRLTPAMLLNLGLSGLAFTGSDVGGFDGEPSPELFARWFSLAAFTPFYRTHAAKHTPPQEPWSFGPEVEAIARAYLGWRYRLLPYLYTAFWQCSQSGLPIMRPLVFACAAKAAFREVDDQWLLGDHLLVSPVLEAGVVERTVLLPPGDWYDFWTDERLVGGRSLRRAAPLSTVPLHVAAGTVLPLAPIRQYVEEQAESGLELHVYAGSGRSWLYEDDGRSLDYREGAFRLTSFAVQETGDRVDIYRSEEGQFIPSDSETTLVLHGGTVAEVQIDGQTGSLTAGKVVLPAMGWRHLRIFVTASPI